MIKQQKQPSRIYIPKHMYSYKHLSIYIHVHLSINIHIHTYMHICMQMYVCVYSNCLGTVFPLQPYNLLMGLVFTICRNDHIIYLLIHSWMTRPPRSFSQETYVTAVPMCELLTCSVIFFFLLFSLNLDLMII